MCAVTTERLEVAGALEVSGEFLVNNLKQWRLAYLEVFSEDAAPTGWDENVDVLSHCAGVTMLGGYGKFAEGETSKEFTDLPPHSHVKVEAVFHFIDRWSGETGFMRADVGRDGSLVYVWTARHAEGLPGGHGAGQTSANLNLCGTQTVPDSKFAQPITLLLPHTSDTLRLAFGSTLKDIQATDASWGVSSIAISVK